MNRYSIGFERWTERAGDCADTALFNVRSGDIGFYAEVSITRTLGSMLDYSNATAKDSIRARLIQLAIPRIINSVDELEDPHAPTASYICVSIKFSSQDAHLFRAADPEKHCSYQ